MYSQTSDFIFNCLDFTRIHLVCDSINKQVATSTYTVITMSPNLIATWCLIVFVSLHIPTTLSILTKPHIVNSLFKVVTATPN